MKTFYSLILSTLLLIPSLSVSADAVERSNTPLLSVSLQNAQMNGDVLVVPLENGHLRARISMENPNDLAKLVLNRTSIEINGDNTKTFMLENGQVVETPLKSALNSLYHSGSEIFCSNGSYDSKVKAFTMDRELGVIGIELASASTEKQKPQDKKENKLECKNIIFQAGDCGKCGPESNPKDCIKNNIELTWPTAPGSTVTFIHWLATCSCH